MHDRVFLDSNIIIYAYSIDEPQKREIVNMLLNGHDMLCISTQTINEFSNVSLRKKIFDQDELTKIVDTLFSVFLVMPITHENIKKAIDLSKKHRYAYFDCLMLASALASNCSILYSEDMHHGHMIDGRLKIVNPFGKVH